jgi:hypothetical protein
LNTAALDTHEMPLLRNLDLLVLVVAAAVFVAAGLPMLGYAVAAGVWLLAKGLQLVLDRQIEKSIERGERRNAMGMTAAAGLGRVWLIALAVLLTGLADRDAGLAAAVLSAILFTVFMLTKLLSEVFGSEEHGAAQ